MKRAAVSMVLVVLALGSFIAADEKRAEVLFQAAMAKETVEGNLQGAIALYESAVSEAGASRALAARALVRMAGCHQKLGDAQARQIFEQVVRDYGDQTAAVAEARAFLARGEAAGATSMALRKVWSDPEMSSESSVSADGRFITYPDWATGNLALYNLATGRSRRLTDDGYVNQAFAQGSAISRDGTQVAYSWYKGKDRYELRLMSLQPGALPQPRTLFDNEDVSWIVPFDWTSDGKWLAVHVARKDRTSHMGIVSVQDGSLLVLKSVEWRQPDRMFFSPNDRYLAYDLPMSDTDSNERDLFVIAVDGSREAHVVANPGHDRVMGWAPDGSRLLFASDRMGTIGLWALPMANERPAGAPILVKTDISPWSIGVTRSGALFTVVHIGGSDVKVASLDLGTGKLAAPPVSPVRGFVGSNQRPDWSPDGKYLSYMSVRDGRSIALMIRALETGQTREVRAGLRYFQHAQWTPDSRSFLVQGQDLRGRPGVYQIDAQTGAITVLATNNGGGRTPQMSPDGTRIYYWPGNAASGPDGAVLVERDLRSGSEREVFRGPEPFNPSLSPDGRYIAGVVSNLNRAKSSALVLIPVKGGAHKEVLRADDGGLGRNEVVTWTPDSRSLIVSLRTKGRPQILLVPVDGGAPRELHIDTPVAFGGVRIHPDGRQIAFTSSIGTAMSEVWVLENFLPALSAKR